MLAIYKTSVGTAEADVEMMERWGGKRTREGIVRSNFQGISGCPVVHLDNIECHSVRSEALERFDKWLAVWILRDNFCTVSLLSGQ